MTLDKDEYSELTVLRIRGVLARAFSVRDRSPTDRQWQMLRGEMEITVRDIGEIGHDLDVVFEAALCPRETADETD